MTNDLITGPIGAANAAELSVAPVENSYDASKRASDVCGRFLRTAALLPEHGFFGVQIDTEKSSCTAFSSRKVAVTRDDFNWIFENIATAGEMLSGNIEELFANGRKVYKLRSIKDSSKDTKLSKQRNNVIYDDEYGDEEMRCATHEKMFEMMKEAGAVVRIAAGPAGDVDGDGHGSVYIGFPYGITLRMRSMISIALPHTEAVEVPDPSEAEDGEKIPDEIFLGCLKGFIYAFMRRVYAEKKKADEEERADDIEDIKDRTTDDDGENPLDELDLSVRSYNCLKRAGIDSVEKLRKMSEDDLLRVRNLGRKCIAEIREKLTERFGTAEKPMQKPRQNVNYTAMLDGLIGLTEVKEQIKKIASYAKMRRDMAKEGCSGETGIVLNMEFVGNPGTAKTTVARIVAGILCEIGLLSSNEIVEVGRADLVANYVGQTATKVQSVFRAAKGKLLFIDEAYSLADCYKGSYGDEAIATIVQEMENNRGDTVVIFAGYPDSMKNFFSRNPGLRSRVPFSVNFRDYGPKEMLLIAESEAKKNGFSISDEARGRITDICSKVSHSAESGNGRFCRNLVEKAILSYASRVYGGDGDSKKDQTLIADDFTGYVLPNEKKRTIIGF